MTQSRTDPHGPAAPGAGARLMALLDEFTSALEEWPGALWQLDGAALGEVVGSMLRIGFRAENVAVLATAEALTRGTVAIVHRDLLTAEVSAAGVTWDPTPGRMTCQPGRQPAA